MSSPLGLILEMISLVISNTINTLVNILELFTDLLHSLGFVSGSGPLAFLIAVLILGVLLFFLAKFFIGSLKTVALLFIAGLVILGILFALV
jgi:hypothetical protein